jgi:hypothetical protein
MRTFAKTLVVAVFLSVAALPAPKHREWQQGIVAKITDDAPEQPSRPPRLYSGIEFAERTTRSQSGI